MLFVINGNFDPFLSLSETSLTHSAYQKAKNIRTS